MAAAALTNAAPVLGSPAIGQAHTLTAAPLSPSAPSLGPAVIGQLGVMQAAPLVNTGPTLGPATIGQRHVLGAAPLVNSAPVLPAPTVTGQGALLPAPLANSSPVIGSPILRERYTLTASPLRNGQPVLGPGSNANAIERREIHELIAIVRTRPPRLQILDDTKAPQRPSQQGHRTARHDRPQDHPSQRQRLETVADIPRQGIGDLERRHSRPTMPPLARVFSTRFRVFLLNSGC